MSLGLSRWKLRAHKCWHGNPVHFTLRSSRVFILYHKVFPSYLLENHPQLNNCFSLNLADRLLDLQRNVWNKLDFKYHLKKQLLMKYKRANIYHMAIFFIFSNIHASGVTLKSAWKITRKETIWLAKLKSDLHLKT